MCLSFGHEGLDLKPPHQLQIGKTMSNRYKRKLFTAVKIISFSSILFLFLISSEWALANNDTDISSVIEKLNHSDENVRKDAAYTLGKLGPNAKIAIPLLIETLKDEKVDVREAAVYALGCIGQEAKTIVPALIDLLKDENFGVRKTAVSALGNIGVAAIPAILNALKDEIGSSSLLGEEKPIEKAARKIFKRIGSDAVPALVKALKDDTVRLAAIDALGFVGQEAKSALPALIEVLKCENADVLHATADALRKIALERGTVNLIIDILIKALKNKNYDNIRREAAFALSHFFPENRTAVPALTEALKDENVNVRRNAAHSLVYMFHREETVIPVLVEALKDEDVDVCITAMEDLGRIGSSAKVAVPILLELLRNKNTTIRRHAVYALVSISTEVEPAIPVLIEALKDKNEYYHRQMAAYTLGKIGQKAKAAIPTLIDDMLIDNDDIMRNAAVFALRDIGVISVPAILDVLEDEISKPGGFSGEENHIEDAAGNVIKGIGANAVDILTESLKDNSIRCAAAYALGLLGADAKAAVPILIEALKDKKTDFRTNVIQTLGNIGSEANTAVPILIELLKDDNVRWCAIDALGNIGSASKIAVPTLVDILRDKKEDSFIRKDVAIALGKIGTGANAAVPALVEALKDEHGFICEESVIALGKIGLGARKAIPAITEAFCNALENENDEIFKAAIHALIEIAEALQEAEVTCYLPFLESANEALTFTTLVDLSDTGRLRRAIQALKAIEKGRLTNILKDFIHQHKLVVLFAGYPVVSLLLSFIILWIRPLWLLRINDVLKPYSDITLPDWLGGIRIPLRFVLMFGFFHYHPRVLDVWVKKNVDLAKEAFQKKDSVRDREVYISVPIVLNGKTITNLTVDDLEQILSKKRWCLVIWGEGGSGKTSLAYQLAKWAMAEDKSLRLCKQHLMLPVLIEEDLNLKAGENKNPFTEAIRGELGGLVGEENPIAEELLVQLLRHRRLLVIVDHFSEMNEATRKAIRPNDPEFPSNALIITSRIEEKLGVPKTNVMPLRIQGGRLSSFMEAYLMQRGKKDLFDDAEYFDECRRLSLMVGNRDTTVLLAKLFAEQMISIKEGFAEEKLPDNIPSLMLNYLNEINRQVVDNKLDDRTVHRIAKVVAWECMRQTYCTTQAKRDDILVAMKDNNEAEVHLNYLEKRLRLIQTIGPEQNHIRFALDPLAEYLAGLYLVDNYTENVKLWQEFISRAATILNTSENINGFILAVRDCCLSKGTEAKIPYFVQSELAKLAGFDRIHE